MIFKKKLSLQHNVPQLLQAVLIRKNFDLISIFWTISCIFIAACSITTTQTNTPCNPYVLILIISSYLCHLSYLILKKFLIFLKFAIFFKYYIKSCAINPCQNNGQCYNSGNCQATCSCAAGNFKPIFKYFNWIKIFKFVYFKVGQVNFVNTDYQLNVCHNLFHKNLLKFNLNF